jgi:basic membrane protein A
MKRLYMLLLVALVLSLVVSACGGAAASPTESTSGGQATSGLAFAMVTDQAGLGDQGFNDAAWEGMQRAKADFGADISVVESKEQAQYVPNFSTLAEQKKDLIVAVGFLLSDAMTEVAPQYPDTHFAIIDSVVDEPNVASITFKENEGSYLVGAIAGMMTKTNMVGFVGGVESDLLKKFEAGYKAGVMTTNPDAQVLVSYTGTFADPAKGNEMANSQYDQGADIVYEVAGLTGTGVINAAKDRNMMAIGVDRDLNYLAPKNVITSMVKRVDEGVYQAAKLVYEGNFKGGHYVYGVAEGGIDIAPTTKDMVPQNVLDTALKLKQMIIDGTVVAPQTLDELASFKPPTLSGQ